VDAHLKRWRKKKMARNGKNLRGEAREYLTFPKRGRGISTGAPCERLIFGRKKTVGNVGVLICMDNKRGWRQSVRGF